MPQISELFVSLGVKGTEKTINALSSVKVGMSNIVSTSIEAKVAILGAVYALEQLTMGAAQDGAHLQNLASYLGASTEQLQKWSYAAQQGNISNQEFESSLLSVYNKIKDYNTSHKLPEGSAIFAQETGFDFTKPFTAFDFLDSALKFTKNKSYSRDKIEKILENWGLTPNEIGAAFTGKFNSANLGNAPFLKQGEVDNLAKIYVLWSNLETKVKMLFAHFTAKNGVDLVKGLSNIADQAFRLADALDRIASKLGVFKLLGETFKGWDVILSSIADKLEGKKSIDEKKNEAQEHLQYLKDVKENQDKNNELSNNFSSLKSIIPNVIDYLKSSLDYSRYNLNSLNPENNFGHTDYSKGILQLFDNNSLVSPLLRNNNSANNNTTLNQNNYFQHEGKELQPTIGSLGTAITQSFRMLNNSRAT